MKQHRIKKTSKLPKNKEQYAQTAKGEIPKGKGRNVPKAKGKRQRGKRQYKKGKKTAVVLAKQKYASFWQSKLK